jgi:hypothetical protein
MFGRDQVSQPWAVLRLWFTEGRFPEHEEQRTQKRFLVTALTVVALAGGAHAWQFLRIGTGASAGAYPGVR